MRWNLVMLNALATTALWSQGVGLNGRVVNLRNGSGLAGATIQIREIQLKTHTDLQGYFSLLRLQPGDHLLVVTHPGYGVREIPVLIEGTDLDLGLIYLEEEAGAEQAEGEFQLLLSDEDEGPGTGYSQAILQAGRDVFLNRAAFDFGQAFFKPRGYDSRYTQVLVNGFSMNGLYDGRPQWHQLGGLNDMLRNQVVAYGLGYPEKSFGSLLGSVAINSRPSALRPGMRISGSATNRSYRQRLMCSYVTEPLYSGLGTAFSASRRWAKEGFTDGRLYDAWSAFMSLEYHFNQEHSIALTAFSATTKRGLSPPLGTEVSSLFGSRYNSYWGYQDGRIRNSRELKTQQPVVQLNYHFEGQKAYLQMGAAYQLGSRAQSRLGYYNAPNPDPVYYRYLPSYAINNPGGPNFQSASLAKEALLKFPQLDWQALYRANMASGTDGKASYLLYEDVSDRRQLQLQSNASLEWGEHFGLYTGLGYTWLTVDNFARIKDMLGAVYHTDLDPFSGSRNDLKGELQKAKGDHFGYDYEVRGTVAQANMQLKFDIGNWQAFAGGLFSTTSYARRGHYQNERFADHSFGPGKQMDFKNWMFKGGLRYRSGARHWWSLNGSLGTLPVPWKYAWINPRESEEQVPAIQNERIHGLEMNYNLRLDGMKGRISAFYTRIMDKTDIHYFYVDAGVGSDFVQEVLTGVDQLHMGLEVGLQQELSDNLTASVVLGLGKYLYASDPRVTINFDTAGEESDLINTIGNVDLGTARLKDYRLATGPHNAISVGLDYHHPEYWWIGVTANYLWANYIHPSAIARTASFSLDPLTGRAYTEANPVLLDRLLQPQPLEEIYLLNLTAGKSWMRKGLYISLFASVSNLFDLEYRTGGYEQSRNGNFGQWQQDQLSGNPSFGPKYWHGQGRGYFLNLAVSF